MKRLLLFAFLTLWHIANPINAIPAAMGESVSGRVAEQGARDGVPGVGIILEDAVRREIGWSTYTDSQGLYRFASIPPGQYSLVVSAPRYQIVPARQIVVESGKDLVGVDIVLEKPRKLHLKPVWVVFFGGGAFFGAWAYLATRRTSVLLATVGCGCITVGTCLEDGFYEYVALGGGVAITAVAMGFFCREYWILEEKREEAFALETILSSRRNDGNKRGEPGSTGRSEPRT